MALPDVRTSTIREGPSLRSGASPEALGTSSMRVAINLLTEDPASPSGAHWVWTRLVPEMAVRLSPGEELHLLVSPRARRHFSGDYGPAVRLVTFPWSNEHRYLRTLTEHAYLPARLPFSQVDVLDTLIAPALNLSWSLVIHMKTMHAFTTPGALPFANRTFRRLTYPRNMRLADVVMINSRSIRAEIERFLDVDPGKFRLVYEAVDHDLFRPGSADDARAKVARYGVSKPFLLFVSSLWPYKNCEGLIRAFASGRFAGRQLVVVGAPRDQRYAARLRRLAEDAGVAADVVFVGGVPISETVHFYRAADVCVYPSFNETFGLPILEAMATGCPVVTSDVTSMPEVAGGAAVLCRPGDPRSIEEGIAAALDGADRLRDLGSRRARQFTWSATATATLDVYRELRDGRARRAPRGP